jgi:hypothetical protein
MAGPDAALNPPSPDPFEQLATTGGQPANDDDPFAKIAQGGGVDPSSKAGAFGRGLERNIIPAVGSFPAIGAGAEMGAAAGAAVGGPFAPITAPVGGLLGGLAGAYLGSTALSSAQNWLLSKAPDSWKEKLGLDDRQQQIDESQHPYASFLGGLAPYALTMRPGFGAAAKLPENATALQKIMAHPVTARLFGGAAMGGMELGNETVSGQPTDWGKVAISTGFGLVWNKPTRIGEAITEAGAKPTRSLLGVPEPIAAVPPKPVTEPEAQPTEAAPAGPPTTAREWNETILGQNTPTIAQAADLGVAGPGITEATFQGGVEPNPSAVMTAQETARTEQSVIGPKPAPDTNALARRIEPETFEQYDALLARQTEFRNWINEYNQPPPELFQELEQKRAALQAQLDAHLAERNGYAGGKDARRLRAQIRDIESQHQDLTDRATRFAAGQAEETADLAMARKHLMATNAELQDLLPKIQSAYRRAAEYSGSETYEPPAQTPPVNQELTNPEVTSNQPLTEESPNVAKPEAVNPPAQEIPGQHPAVESGTAPAEGAAVAPTGQALASPAAREPGAGIGETAVPPPAVAPAPKTIEQQRDYIRADVARQLVKAGRPEEEAQAAGALEAAYYETRAARFGGKLGTPEELYEREGPEILGQGQKSQQGIVRQPNAPRKIDETKLSLLQFLARRGGIDAGERNISDVRSLIGTKNKFVPGFGSLIRHGGMSLDKAREAAVEAGYLHDAAEQHGGVTESSINQLLEAMDGELRGQKVYRAGYMPETVPTNERPPEEGEASPAETGGPREPLSPLMTEADYAELFQIKQDQRDLFGESEPQKELFDTEIPPEAIEKAETPQAEAAAEKPALELTPTEPKGIQDFGEKIEGARKDTFTGFRDSLREEMDVAAEPLSKSFPQPNYEKLAADGVNNRSLAYIAIMRDMIPNKPRRSYKVKQWGAQVETLRSFSRMLLDGEIDPATLDARMKDNYALRTLPLTAEAIADIAPADLPRAAKYRVNSASYSMLNGQRYSPSKTFWFIESPESRTLRNPLSNDPANPYTYRDTPAEAVALAKQLIPLELAKEAAAPEGQRSKYTEVNLFRDRATGGVYLGLKVRSTVIRLKAGFEDVKAAREYLQENRDNLQKTIDEMRQGPNERGTENRPRTGESLRVGDVAPQSFDSTFGFRGVQFGNYVEDARRQADLNRAYDALMDLSDVLGVPPKALSLNGQLGMAFGARGTGGSRAAAAHYEPIQVVINLTKGAGPGSLAHEWLHAVDNYFARQDAGKDKSTNYISANHRDTGLVRDEVYQAWKNVEKTLQSGGFAERSAKFDEARSKPYWNTTIEKAARSFEKYVIDRLDEKGAVNDYLANIDTSGGAYPTSDEMQSSGMRAAYDRLFDTIETRNTDRGVEMYQGAQGGIVLNPHGLPGRDWLGSEDAKPILRITKDGNASTFIHETGHKYLADLLRDSAHPEAPQDLRDDAATVQHWLGIDSPETLTRKAHEKFARGFEQYLREGTAPSPQLASVFAKFKQWLVSIYQTLKGLGKPINDDIRAVFDRLLAENPQRTVIAPETEMRPTLADIHEADALHTEPAQKEAVQAQVDQERQRAYDEYPHEKRQAAEEELAKFYAEHEQANEPGSDGTNPADRGGPDQPGAGGLSEVQPNGGAAQSGPADGGMGAGTGAQRQGVNGTGAGSDGLRGSNDRNAGSGPESNPLAPNPAHTFGSAESGAVDKAGNIRVENVTSLEGLAQAIHDSADRNGDFKAVRGAMTEGQKVDLANELNLDPSTIDEAKLGQMFGGIDNLAPKIWALRTLLRDSAQVVFDSMRKVTETNSDEDAAAFAIAAARHDMIQGTVSKVTAEMGRGLGMGFKNLEGYEQAQNLAEFVKGATGKELFQLKMMAKLGAKLDTPAKVSKFLRDGQKRTFGGMLLEYWINGLISGIATHVTYTAGNGALNATRALLEAPTAALIGKLREAMGEEGQHVQFGEVGARVKRGFGSLPAALQGSLEAVQQGVTTLLPGETGRAMMPFAGDDQLIVGRTLTNEPVTWGDLRNDVAGAFRGMRNGIIGTANLVGAGGEAGAPMFGASYTGLGQIPDLAFKGVPVLPVGTAIRAPGRMIAGIHSFFRISTYSMELAAEAYRTATYEGLEGEAFAARAGDLIQNPTEAMMARATKTATEQALMGQGSAFTQSLSKLTNTPIGGKLNPETGQIEGGIRLLKFVDPFVHIASNVIDQSIIKRTPLGLLSPELRHDLMGRPDPVTGKIDIAARDMAQARMLVGSALGVTFAGLASQGYISGSGPSDAKQGAMWRLAGNQAHSVKIGDIWYDVHRLGPLGMLLGISADMYDVAHTAAEGDIVTAASHLQHALTQNILDESFMRGPSALIQAIEDPERYGQQYIENTLASFVPFSVGMAQMERASDPYSRRARTVMDAIKAKVPGLSETLYPKRDIWGNEIPNLPSFGGRAISAFYEQQISHDPVNIAMIQLGISPAQVERKIRNIDLDDGQYDDFSRLSGRMSKQRLDMIVRSPDFQSWPNNIKVNVITEVIRQSREAARGMMMMKYPDLLMQGVQAQKDKRLGVDAKSVQRRTELNR